MPKGGPCGPLSAAEVTVMRTAKRGSREVIAQHPPRALVWAVLHPKAGAAARQTDRALPHYPHCYPFSYCMQPRLPDISPEEASAALAAHPFEGRWQVILSFTAVELQHRPGTTDGALHWMRGALRRRLTWPMAGDAALLLLKALVGWLPARSQERSTADPHC